MPIGFIGCCRIFASAPHGIAFSIGLHRIFDLFSRIFDSAPPINVYWVPSLGRIQGASGPVVSFGFLASLIGFRRNSDWAPPLGRIQGASGPSGSLGLIASSVWFHHLAAPRGHWAHWV